MGFTMLPSLQTEIADPIQSLQNATTPVYYMCRPGLRSFFLEDMKDWDAVNIVVVSFSIWTLSVWLPKPPIIQLPQSSCFGLVRLKQLFNSELKWWGGGKYWVVAVGAGARSLLISNDDGKTMHRELG